MSKNTIKKDRPKITKAISFAGENGYKALDVLDNEEIMKEFGSRSDFIVKLILFYEKANNKLGEHTLVRLMDMLKDK